MPGASELVDVGGDPQQHPPDTIAVNHDVAAVGMIGVWAQVDHRRGLDELELLKPAGAVAQPSRHCAAARDSGVLARATLWAALK